MGNLYRMRWGAKARFTIFGVRIGLRANVPELLDRLIALLPRESEALRCPNVDCLYSAVASNHVQGCNKDRGYNLLFRNGRKLTKSKRWEDLHECFESDLDFYVAKTTPSWLFLHAGVIALQGQAIVLPGRSYCGKTTLVKAFLDAGATYYSDEFAVLDQKGDVHPFPRALSVRTNGIPTKIAAEQFGAQVGQGPIPVGLVILARYKPGAQWRPNLLTPGGGMLGLLQNTLTGRLYPHFAIKTLEKVTRRARVLESARGEAADTAGWVLRNLNQVSTQYC